MVERQKSLIIIISVISIIVIIVLFFSSQNIELTANTNYSKISEFSINIVGSNVNLFVRTIGEMPENLSYENTESESLAFGYLWINSQTNPNEFVGIFTNHHLIMDSFNQGWHTEIAKVSTNSNANVNFCLELDEIFGETIISSNSMMTIIPSTEFNLKSTEGGQIYSIETILTNSCPSNIGAIVIQHLYE